jgi:hypothetical protein
MMHMEKKIEIDITDDDHEWVERIGKTVYEICNEPARLILLPIRSDRLMIPRSAAGPAYVVSHAVFICIHCTHYS